MLLTKFGVMINVRTLDTLCLLRHQFAAFSYILRENRSQTLSKLFCLGVWDRILSHCFTALSGKTLRICVPKVSVPLIIPKKMCLFGCLQQRGSS